MSSKDTEEPAISLEKSLSKLSLDPQIFGPFVEAVLADKDVSEEEKRDTLCESLSSSCLTATHTEVDAVVKSLISIKDTLPSSPPSSLRGGAKRGALLPSDAPTFRPPLMASSPWASHTSSTFPSLYSGRDPSAPPPSSYFPPPSTLTSSPASLFHPPSYPTASLSLGLSTSSSEVMPSSYSPLAGLGAKEGLMASQSISMAQSPPSHAPPIPGSALTSSPGSGILPTLSPSLRPTMTFGPEPSMGLGRSTSMNLSFLRTPVHGENPMACPPSSMGILGAGPSTGGLCDPKSLSSISSTSFLMTSSPSSPSSTVTVSSVSPTSMGVSSSPSSLSTASRLTPMAQPFTPGGSSSHLTPTAEPFTPSGSSQLTPTAQPFTPGGSVSYPRPSSSSSTPSSTRKTTSRRPAPKTVKEVLAGWERGELDMGEFAALMNILDSGGSPSGSSSPPPTLSPPLSQSSYSSGVDVGIRSGGDLTSSSLSSPPSPTMSTDVDGWTIEEIEEVEEEMEGMQPLTPLGLLCSVFPGIPPDRLSTALSLTGYDIQKALTLLTDTGTSPSSPSSSSPPPNIVFFFFRFFLGSL
ncbi:hypothetical protein BJ684DRAFT_19922 [Piptocephalis cylindrospora]|uniref:Uncharacterized protein n=1 Tax=Piptocephalis cylindrospora TaxID=1907219 RepID=A0A4P9Y438_9FUNG|nr:hypothetical protein BJ684DRAFT_19922 [Piptocephalis cylindrospora]|eukprot:RKP13603.1 hypothetical protein BJ684DRAFT_19922 [Piptocephalis cylindrospora]